MLRSVISNWLGLIVMGLTSVILTPVLIHGLGNLYFGMWVLVSSALDYYGLLDLGMRWTLFRFVARFKGANDREALNQTLVTAVTVTCVIALLIIALTFVLVPFLPAFFKLNDATRGIFQWLLILIGVSAAITFPAYLLGAYLRGLQRFDLYNLALTVSTLVRGVLLIVVLRMGYGIIAVAWVTLAIAVFSLAFHWWLVRRADPELVASLRCFSFARMRELIGYSFYSFLNSTGENLRSYTDSIVIGRVLGVALITPFSIATRLMMYYYSVMVTFHGPLMARLSEMVGEEHFEELREAFLRSTRFMAVLSLYCGAVLILNGQGLIHFWIGEKYLESYPLTVILTIGYIVSFSLYPCMLVVFALGRNHQKLGLWTLAEGLANLGLSIYWARRYGLVGVAYGTMVPLVLVKVFVHPWYALRAIQLPLREFVNRALLRPVVMCGIFVAICLLADRMEIGSGVPAFLLTILWQSLLFWLLAYWMISDHSERQWIRERGRQLATALRLA